MRGTLTEAGKESPYRNRPISETKDLFKKMTDGLVEEGKMVLRAKIENRKPRTIAEKKKHRFL